MKSTFWSKNWRSIILVAALVLLAGLITVVAGNHQTPTPLSNSSPTPTVSPTPPDSDRGVPVTTESKSTPSPTAPASQGNIKPIIATLTQDASFVRLRAFAETTTEVTCEATFSKAGAPDVKRTSGSQIQAGQTACQGFNIEKSALSPGAWTARVRMYTEALNGTSDSQPIEVH